MSRGKAVVAGAIARNIEAGGHVWAMLQWALGLRSLGYDVLFLDTLDPEPGLRSSDRVGRLDDVMRRMGFGTSYSLDLGPEGCVGIGRKEVESTIREADFLLNIMGYLRDEALLGAARCRIFLDIDPGFGQMWCALGLCDPFRGHEWFVTVGTRVGDEDCEIPTCGIDWIPTLPPVDLDRWTPDEDPGASFSSVGAWRGPYDAVEFRGVRYGLRAHEFRRFAQLPSAAGRPLEVALDIATEDAADARRLRRGGWRLVDPRRVAGDPDAYRRYVTGSRGEFGVAKEMYVRSRSGWLSDRTACYLASGRPVVVQDTGQSMLPSGEGLVTFRDPEDAIEALLQVDADWTRHSRAARALAEAHLDGRAVLERMLGEVAA